MGKEKEIGEINFRFTPVLKGAGNLENLADDFHFVVFLKVV
jgi:hypothetical protein